MPTCPKCEMLIPDNPGKCIYCGAIVSPRNIAGKEKKETGCVGGIFLGLLYLFVWPVFSFIALTFFLSLFPGCSQNGCKGIDQLVLRLPNEVIVLAFIGIVGLFVVSFSTKIKQVRWIQFLLTVHRYACIFSPGNAGFEGFAWPVPFLAALAMDFNYPAALRMLLQLFVMTWVVVFLIFSLRGFFQGNHGKPDKPMPPKVLKEH